jgi:hypothetical protein
MLRIFTFPDFMASGFRYGSHEIDKKSLSPGFTRKLCTYLGMFLNIGDGVAK